MPTLRERLARMTPRQLGSLLLVSFGLTVLSFVIATVVAIAMARGIARAANDIASTTVPLSSHLSRMLSEVERQTALTGEIVERLSTGQQSGALATQLQGSRATLAREWQALESLQPSPQEQELYTGIRGHLSKLDAGVGKLLDQAARTDATGTLATLDTELRPEVERLAEELRTVGELNRHRAVELSTTIVSHFRTARRWGLSLTALSALFACLTALAVVRIVRRYAESAEAAVTEMETFAGRVAHDIRSPLASVGLALDLSRRNAQLDERSRAMLERGTRTVQQMGQLVDGLLVFARAGAPPEGGASAPVAEVVTDVLQTMRPAAEEKEIELRVEQAESCAAACHPGVLTSIVSNLVGNAIKYMGGAVIRRVDLRVHCTGGMVRLAVQDTGPGIPPELQERIFSPHVRAAAATVPGLGLGLATVRRLAEAHGGAAGVESTSGEGSLFWVELPRADESTSVTRLAPVRTGH